MISLFVEKLMPIIFRDMMNKENIKYVFEIIIISISIKKFLSLCYSFSNINTLPIILKIIYHKLLFLYNLGYLASDNS